jgi:hypothetical protein
VSDERYRFGWINPMPRCGTPPTPPPPKPIWLAIMQDRPTMILIGAAIGCLLGLAIVRL